VPLPQTTAKLLPVNLTQSLENKIITNIFAKLIKVADKWVDWIHLSFLPEEMKAQYQTILQAKIEKIQ
ncbi:MAG: hypothetical protein RSD44_08995, partial [Akkermansia sp.]